MTQVNMFVLISVINEMLRLILLVFVQLPSVIEQMMRKVLTSCPGWLRGANDPFDLHHRGCSRNKTVFNSKQLPIGNEDTAGLELRRQSSYVRM